MKRMKRPMIIHKSFRKFQNTRWIEMLWITLRAFRFIRMKRGWNRNKDLEEEEGEVFSKHQLRIGPKVTSVPWNENKENM